MITRTRSPRPSIALLAFVGASTLFASLALAVQPDALQHERLAQVRVPFVENCGQWDERVAFAANTAFGAAFVTRDGQLVYSLSGETERWALTETFVSGKPVPQPLQPAVTRVSYFHGNDSRRWRSDLSSYDEVGLGEVWRGISVSVRASGTIIEKIFTLAPGAKASRIRLRVDGAKALRIDGDGALLIDSERGEARFTPPSAYQEWDGIRRSVAVTYVVHGAKYGFRLGSYDPSLAVIIDPLLQSTYLGGSSPNVVTAIAIHPTTEEVFVAGYTESNDFPQTAGGADPVYGGGYDGFVARLNPTLTALLQATYFGGGVQSSAGDLINAIAIHPTTGDVFIAGATGSTDLPGTLGGAQPSPGGNGDGFVARLDSTLTVLLQATYLGGSQEDGVLAIAVDPTGAEVLVTGSATSTDFPGTIGGAVPSPVAPLFTARLNATLTTILQASYVGGSAIAIHPTTGEVFVAVSTGQTDLPGTLGGAQSSSGGGNDGFVARFDSTLTTLLQATYFGGSSNDGIESISIHASTGEVLLAGWTLSNDLPNTTGGAQQALNGYSDGFVARLNTALTSILQATFLGGSGGEWISGLSIHPATGEVLVAGRTFSDDFPGTALGAQPGFGGYVDGFVARLDPTLESLLLATYLGGGEGANWGADSISSIAVDGATGDIVVAGATSSVDFPGTAGGAQPTPHDAFVARFTQGLGAVVSPAALALDASPNPGDGDLVFEPGETVTLTPAWENPSDFPASPNGTATVFTGPGGANYSIVSDAVSYPSIPPGGVGIANGSYVLSISVPDTRPARHWDAWLTEGLDVQYVLPYRWKLHIGDSFADVPRTNIFYRSIESVLHHGITAGCGGSNYCPDSSVSRAQMAVLLLKSKHGPTYVPAGCTGIFGDVICGYTPFANWIEELFHEGITGGCGGGNYCPNNPVTRAQMAAFLLKAEHGSSYVPPSCNGIFGDVACPSLFADWIEQLAAEGITGGCGGGNYCPNNPSTRGQMAAFLVKTFGLQLYGP